MKNISQYSRSILLLLGDRKKKVPWLILAFLATSFLEVIGIGLIAPYISLIINPESFIENYNTIIKKSLNLNQVYFIYKYKPK